MLLWLSYFCVFLIFFNSRASSFVTYKFCDPITQQLQNWAQGEDGEWEWEEQDSNYVASQIATEIISEATPKLPSGNFRPKQSLGQNYLRDGNTVNKILRAFHKDATRYRPNVDRIIELGPGAGALTDPLVKTYGTETIQCIEIDERSVELLGEKHPNLKVHHQDVLQVDYPQMAQDEGKPLVVFGNLPYYITSQILFALADASHSGAVYSATVTMQWEVAQRMVASPSTKDYGILSVVFQLYAECNCHFKIPPTVFYPQPKVDSALIGLHFLGPNGLRKRLDGVDPKNFRYVVTTAFRQRRKTVRNSLKKLVKDMHDGDAEKTKAILDAPPLPLTATIKEAKAKGDKFANLQELPVDWAKKRPEEFTSGQFIELTRLLYGPADGAMDSSVPLGTKVWRKLKHGS